MPGEVSAEHADEGVRAHPVGQAVADGADKEEFSREKRGRPGQNTRYRRRVKNVFSIEAVAKTDMIAYDAATDGCFPMVSNADEATPAQVLGIYRYQPNLERRNHMLKGPQAVAPVFIENSHRIEVILLCHFLAMSADALIEREIRNSMKVQGRTGIPLYPELRKCPSPSAPRILEIFADAQRHHLVSKGEVVQDFDPELTPASPPGARPPPRTSRCVRLIERFLTWGRIRVTRSAERQFGRSVGWLAPPA